MNNDKLLIVVIVLVIYLMCFRRSEGQEICQYNQGDLDSAIETKLNSFLDDGVKFSDWVKKHQHYSYNGMPGDHTGDHLMRVNDDQTSGPKMF